MDYSGFSWAIAPPSSFRGETFSRDAGNTEISLQFSWGLFTVAAFHMEATVKPLQEVFCKAQSVLFSGALTAHNKIKCKNSPSNRHLKKS